METLNIDRIVKGEAVRVDRFQIVILARLRIQAAGSGSEFVGFGAAEPIGIQIRTEAQIVGLDMEGRNSEELARL